MWLVAVWGFQFILELSDIVDVCPNLKVNSEFVPTLLDGFAWRTGIAKGHVVKRKVPKMEQDFLCLFFGICLVSF